MTTLLVDESSPAKPANVSTDAALERLVDSLFGRESNVIPLRAATVGKRLADRDVIEAQVSEACRSRNIHGQQADSCHEAAMLAFVNGASTAVCVEAGVKAATAITRGRACVRSRGHDDLPPAA